MHAASSERRGLLRFFLARKRDVASNLSTKESAFIGLELHLHRLAIGLGGLEELARRESEHSCQNVRGK